MHDLHGDIAAGRCPPGAPTRGAGTAPTELLPIWAGRRFVDLVAESLREVARRDRDAVYQMMAHAIVQHLAVDVQASNSRRSVEEALDGVLSLISTELQCQVARSRETRARQG